MITPSLVVPFDGRRGGVSIVTMLYYPVVGAISYVMLPGYPFIGR